MATPTIQGGSQGFPAYYGQHTRNIIANAQGDPVVVSPSSGDALVAVAIGMKQYNPFDLLHGSTPAFGYLQGINDFSVAPTITDSNGQTWTFASSGNGSLINADVDPSVPTYSSASLWNLDGFYPSVFIAWTLNVAAGSTTVRLNSDYKDGISGTSGAYLASGKPIFDGGVNFSVFDFSGIATSSAGDGGSSAVSTANPAVGGTFTTGSSGDLIISVGIMKSGNAFSVGSGFTELSRGVLVGSEAHYMIQYQVQTSAGAINPGFVNPLGYEMLVASVALKHS
jgi:hypothetical protein